jgi:hypothetical protein
VRLAGLLLGLAGAAIALWPSLLATRFAVSAPAGVAVADVLSGLSLRFGLVLCVVGVTILASRRLGETRAKFLLQSSAIMVSYLLLADALRDWMIDDAAITFAYAENLARGHGLVISPGRAPEEAYSNTLWMLLLAAGRTLGAQVDALAKVLSLACGAAAVVLALEVDRRLVTASGERDWLRTLLIALVACAAPFLVWSGSGLEHSLQALLLTSVAAWPLVVARPTLWTGASLACLALLRPETPLIVVAVTLAHVLEEKSLRACLRRFVDVWPVWGAPLVAWLSLMTFRILYFGDVAPNPFYAKASGATVVSIFNLLGPGWDYVFAWASGSAALVLVPLVLAGSLRPLSRPLRLCIAMIAAQLTFVVYAGGDWMDCFRFIAPILPLLALLTGAAHGALRIARSQKLAVGLACASLLAVGTSKQYASFLVDPTTPYALVARVGEEFAALGGRLGVREVKLAHHDAGGTTYKARLDLVDLCGIGNRTIAKHMRDPDFVTRYLVEEERPDFVFGTAAMFAAHETRFQRRPEFLAAYVPLEFEDKPHMAADLSYVRRDLVRDGPGLRPVIEDGVLAKLVVEP